MKRKPTCTNYFIILEKRFSRERTQNSNAKIRARPDITFWAVGYHSPAFHIYYVKYENTLTCKRISWDSGDDVLKIFFYFLYGIQKVTILAPK